MTAGLPGAGMGALLYLFLVMLLPLRQLWAPGQTKKDWRSIARQCAIIAGMVVVAFLETEIAERLGFISAGKIARRLPFFLLGGVFLALEVARWVLALKKVRGAKIALQSLPDDARYP